MYKGTKKENYERMTSMITLILLKKHLDSIRAINRIIPAYKGAKEENRCERITRAPNIERVSGCT